MRHIIIAIALVATIAAESEALAPFSSPVYIKSSHITKQSNGMFRYIIETDIREGQTGFEFDVSLFGQSWTDNVATAALNQFQIFAPSGATNFFFGGEGEMFEQSGGLFVSPSGRPDTRIGPTFGFDFSAPDNITSWAVNWASTTNYNGYFQPNGAGQPPIRPWTLDAVQQTGTTVAQVVPEPSTLLLLGLGLVGAFRLRRVSRRSSSNA